MFENKKRGLGVYKKDHGSDESYKYYKDNTIEELQVDKKTYRKICDEFNKLFIDEILISSEEMRLPYRLGTVSHNGRIVEEVQPDKLLYIRQSPLLKPTRHRRIYVREGSDITVYPNTSNIEFTYITAPSKPSWGYFVVGAKALFDSSSVKTTHFDLHISEENELVYKILKYAGISMQKEDILRAGQGLETLKVQQEKL